MSDPKHIAREHELLYIYSMGKRLRVTAIYTETDAANAHMGRTDDAVIAVLGPFILLANKYDKGLK